jgi:hypothetical protein
MAIFWDVAPCSFVETDRRFRGAYCIHYQGDSHLEIIRTPEYNGVVALCILEENSSCLKFICGLFIDVVSSSHYIAPNGRVINE